MIDTSRVRTCAHQSVVELESTALDHSAIVSVKSIIFSPTRNRTSAARVKGANPNHWTIGDFYYQRTRGNNFKILFIYMLLVLFDVLGVCDYY